MLILKQKKLYIKLMAFFTGLAFIIVVLLYTAFQKIYKDALLHEMFSTYENDLHNRAIEIENLAEEIDYVYLTVIGNPEVEHFVEMETWNPMDEYKAKQQFKRFRNIHSKIHSVYLYNGNLGYVITTDSAGDNLTYFFDKEVFETMTQYKQIRVREIASASTPEKPEQVVSFSYSKYDENDRLESSVVINIIGLTELGILGTPDSASMLLLDKNQNLLMASTKDVPSVEILPDKIRKEAGSYVEKDAEGSRYVVSYYSLPTMNWTLVSLHNYETVMGNIQSQTSKVLYLAIAILLASGMLIPILSKNYYRPIDNFIRKIKKADLGSKSGEKQRSELDYLMDSFNEMMEKMDQTRQDHQQIMEDTRQSFFRQALTCIQGDNETHIQAQRYDIDINKNYFFTLVVQIDQYYMAVQEYRVLCKTTIRQIVEGELKSHFNAIAVTMQGGATAAILFADEPFEINQLLPTLQSIVSLVKKALGQSITIGLGEQVSDFEEIYSSYEVALSMAKWRLTLGYGKILSTENLPPVESPSYPDDLEKKLLETLYVEKQAEYTATVDDLIERLRSYDADSAKLYLTQILLIVVNSINQIEGESRDSANLGELSKFLSNVEVLDQARELFLNYFEEYHILSNEASLKKNSQKLEAMIRQAKSFLEENSKDPGLSVEMVANHFGYTSSYFAKLFKDNAGQSINSYIKQCRIGQAKALLAETTLTVNEIAELTGYGNTNYFFFAFKKFTGVTPAVYRDGKKNKN